MPGTRTSFETHDCGFAQALEAIGDQWCLLILRDFFLGLTRFDDFAEHLSISTKVLADRLKRLEASELIVARADPRDGRGKIYQLTGKGEDLGPLIGSFTQWGEKWVPKKGGPRTEIFDLRTGEPVMIVPISTESHRVLAREDIGQRTGPGGSRVRDHVEDLLEKRNPSRC